MKDLLNEMVAERDTSDPHDFNGKEQDLSISKLSSAAFNITLLLPRGVARGGPGGQSPPEFVRSVNLIQTMRGGGQIMPVTLLPAPCGFKMLSTPLFPH